MVALNCLVRSYRSATASLLSATPKKNVSCFLDLAGVRFFLKEERTFFFGVLPSKYSGRWRNNADSVLPNYFLGKGFGKTSTDLDFASGGVWGGILRLLHPFSFGEIRGGLFLGKALKVGINFVSQLNTNSLKAVE